MSDLDLDGVTKVFDDDGDDIVAVDDVSIDIADGEFLVLVGPSGCGKSTTLRMIAGLETITDGEIALDGRVLNEVPPQERDIAMVFQSYALYPHRTARGNMSFGLEESTDRPKAEIRERVESVAEMMGITDLLDRKPGQLSGGQQQRVALGRAIVREPSVFLMDEPLSNLDAKLRAEMRTELQQLQQQLGVTTIYVTHDQTEAMTMGDRIAVMNDGELQQLGEPLELYHEPTNLFVAGFIGEPAMNVVHGHVADGEFVSNDFHYPLDDEILDAIDDSGSIALGVRPEDVELGAATRSGRDTAHEFEFPVSVVEPMGIENVVHLDFPGLADGTGDLVAVTDGLQQVAEGNMATVHIPIDAVHVFDTETGDARHNRRLEYTDLAPRP